MSDKRQIRKVPFFLDVEFKDTIPQEKIREVAEKIALALNNAIDSGMGLAPDPDNNGFEGTFTNKVRIMCKDVVLLEEDHTKMREDGSRVIDIQNIQGSVPQTPEEIQLEEANTILRNILCESGSECEYDKEIYDYLKENNELPEDYEPYWD